MFEDDDGAHAASAGDAAPERGDRTAIVGAAMACFAALGFAATTLDDIARATRIAPATLHAVFADKGAIMRAFSVGVDRAVLATPLAADGPFGRRIAAVLWRRLEVMAPYRDGLARVVDDLPGRPVLSVPFGLRVFRSVRKMLDHVGIDTAGAGGAIRVRAVTFLYAEVMRVWLDDRSADWRETTRALEAGLATLGHLAPAMRSTR